MTRETVLKDTPASRATSLMVATLSQYFFRGALYSQFDFGFVEIPPFGPR